MMSQMKAPIHCYEKTSVYYRQDLSVDNFGNLYLSFPPGDVTAIRTLSWYVAFFNFEFIPQEKIEYSLANNNEIYIDLANKCSFETNLALHLPVVPNPEVSGEPNPLNPKKNCILKSSFHLQNFSKLDLF